MRVFKNRGGAHIGWVSATWPLAGIEVADGKLQLSSMGNYVFTPNEVSAVEPVGSIPVLSRGIRIHHTKAEYPERVVFYTLYGRQATLDAIEAAGFHIGHPVSQARRGFPLRFPALIAVIFIWNLFFLLERPSINGSPGAPGPYTFLALAMLFGLATLLPTSARLQGLFMREGRDVREISSALRLVQLISGVMLLGFGAAYIST